MFEHMALSMSSTSSPPSLLTASSVGTTDHKIPAAYAHLFSQLSTLLASVDREAADIDAFASVLATANSWDFTLSKVQAEMQSKENVTDKSRGYKQRLADLGNGEKALKEMIAQVEDGALAAKNDGCHGRPAGKMDHVVEKAKLRATLWALKIRGFDVKKRLQADLAVLRARLVEANAKLKTAEVELQSIKERSKAELGKSMQTVEEP